MALRRASNEILDEMMSKISSQTISMLFGNAAGRCSVCKTPLAEKDVRIGEMAHIIAKRSAGPRGEVPFEGDINGYDNLILLCPNHHSQVDKYPDDFSPDTLRKIKREHENYVRSLFNNNSQARVMDVNGLAALMLFLPFTQLHVRTASLPERCSIDLMDFLEVFEWFSLDNPQCRPFSDSDLESHFAGFLDQVAALWNYVQLGVINRKNVYLPGNVVGADFRYCYLNRELGYEENSAARATVRKLLGQLFEQYENLMGFLRRNYPEVNLASYVR